MANSTQEVLVYKIGKLEKHPQADSLFLTRIGGDGGYQCIVNNETKEGDLRAFIPPDSIVQTTRPEFSFLDKKQTGKPAKIRACKLRGMISCGLLVPAPAGSNEGDDVREILQVEHYEPQENVAITRGNNVPAPPGIWTKYDIETVRKYTKIFQENEPVFITEKIHGCFSRYVNIDGSQYIGSRSLWKKEDDNTAWAIAYRNTLQIKEFCSANPGLTLLGECYGQVQDLKYGIDREVKAKFATFDIRRQDQTYLDVEDFISITDKFNIPRVPTIEINYPFNLANIEKITDRDSQLCPGQLMEGVVIKPMKEGWDESLGRRILKLVGTRYLLS